MRSLTWILVAFVSGAAAVGCQDGLPEEVVQKFLDGHNALRAKVASGTYTTENNETLPAARDGIPPLEWSCTLEIKARPASERKQTYEYVPGENIHFAINPTPLTLLEFADSALKFWEKELQTNEFELEKDTTETKWAQLNGRQMIWAKTRKIGCAINVRNAKYSDSAYVICEYEEIGNQPNEKIYEPRVEVVEQQPPAVPASTTEPSTTPTTSTTTTTPAPAAAPSATTQCPGGIPESVIQEFLAVHNELRANISSGTFVAKDKTMPASKAPIAPLKWNCEVEKAAQDYADGCSFTHGDYGENLFALSAGSEVPLEGLGRKASESWASEFQEFGWPYGPQLKEEFLKNIGHATQMAWETSLELGCGIGRCSKKTKPFVVCRYAPGGNYLGGNVYEPKE